MAKEANVFWKCEVCGFEAEDDEERQEHMRKNEEEPAHMAAQTMEGMEEE